MATTGFDQSISRLAQYRPFAEQGQDMTLALEELVVVAAAIAGGNFSSLAACQDAIRTLWGGLELEMDEIRSAVAALDEQGRATRIGGGFELSPDEQEAREQTAAESAAIEATALADWKELLFRLDPRLTDDDFEVLCDDLHTWLGRVVSRHGVEAALILYPENPRAQELFRNVEALGLSFLPTRSGPVQDIRERGFQFFVRQPSEAQRQFLANLLNTTFYVTVLTLDPEGSRLIQQQLRGHRVYLDTNFLYAVLGLSKATEVLSANRLLELTRNLGYELAVTPWTVRELRTSLDGAKNRILRRPLPRRELADLMVKAGGDLGSFVTAFWIAYRDRGTQPKDFFDYYSHIETLLESHEIHVVDEGCTAVGQDQAAIDEQLVLLERFLGWQGREEVVKEHDVKHRLLVERLRGNSHVRFSNARFWFLTQDSKLPRYGATTLDRDPVELPFCVSTSAWAQVMRSFTPRTADYDQTIVDLLATPYVRYRGAVNPRVVEEVVGRIDQFEGADANLASEVLADTALVKEIAQAQGETEVADRIENAFIMKAQEVRLRLDETLARESESREAAAAAAEAASVEATLRRAASDELRRQQEERAATEAQLRARLASEEEEKRQQESSQRQAQEALRDEIDDLRKWFRWAVGSILILMGIGIGVGPLAAGAVDKALPTVIAICSAALLVFGGLMVAFGRRRGGRLVVFAVTAVGFVGAIYTIVVSVKNP